MRLSKPEALVFFERLAKAGPLGAMVLRHPSEEKVIWKLQGQLEPMLPEPLDADYGDIHFGSTHVGGISRGMMRRSGLGLQIDERRE